MCSVYAYTHTYTYTFIYRTLVEQMKCERARETVIIIFVRTVWWSGGGVGKNGGVGFALDISLIPGHGSLFVSRGEEYMCTRVCIRRDRGRENAYVCMCMARGGWNKGVVEYKKNKYIYTLRRAYSAQYV